MGTLPLEVPLYACEVLCTGSRPETLHRELQAGGRSMLGIEVTDPRLASQCSLGNIDPQHGDAPSQVAAIDVALAWPLPPAGSVLVTIRPDLDSLGAMAVLSMRARGVTLSEGAIARIRRISASDRFDHGPWNPRTQCPGVRHTDLGGIAALVSDHAIPIATRVAAVERWLHSGAAPSRDREQGVHTASAQDTSVTIRAAGRLAVVDSALRGALAAGYAVAPVVLARNPAFRFAGGQPHLKYTIAQFAPGHVNMAAVLRDLAAVEPGWGGSPTIIGSPHGTASAVAPEEVEFVVVRHLSRLP